MATAPNYNINIPYSAFLDPTTGRPTQAWLLWLMSPNFININLANAVPVASGGTGLSTIPTNGQLLIGNGTGYSLNTLGAGQNIQVTNGAGTVSVGITGQIPVVNGGTGANNATDARANLSAAKSGANSDITSLTGITGGIESPTYVQFDTAATPTISAGTMGWNSTDQTLDLGMDYGVIQQIGEETYARVQNNTGVTIPNGTVVGFAGSTSNALLVAPYLADGSQPTLYILGVMTHDLPDSGEKGYCTTWGFVRNIDTSAFSAGDILYASPTVAGAFTNVKPTAPDNVIPLAACVISDVTAGVIFVRPTIQQMQYYGVFTKTTDQTPAVINTEYLITFDNTQISNGVVIGGTTSQIIVPESGLYNFSATVQLTSGSSSSKNIWVWWKKNGTAISNSARLVTSDVNNGYIPIALNETISLAANDYIEMAFAADSTNVTIDTVAATAFAPAAPAVVLNVTQSQQ